MQLLGRLLNRPGIRNSHRNDGVFTVPVHPYGPIAEEPAEEALIDLDRLDRRQLEFLDLPEEDACLQENPPVGDRKFMGVSLPKSPNEAQAQSQKVRKNPAGTQQVDPVRVDEHTEGFLARKIGLSPSHLVVSGSEIAVVVRESRPR